jgi:hypothetical protein
MNMMHPSEMGKREKEVVVASVRLVSLPVNGVVVSFHLIQ